MKYKMKASIVNLDEQTTETLRAMLDPGYISERTERLEAIETLYCQHPSIDQ